MKSRLTLIQTIVVCFVLCSLALGQDLASFEKRTTVKKLANGLTIIICERPEAPVFSFFTHVDAGSVQDPWARPASRTCSSTWHSRERTQLAPATIPAKKLRSQKLKRPMPPTLPNATSQWTATKRSWRSSSKPGKTRLLRPISSPRLTTMSLARSSEGEGGEGMNAFTDYDETGYHYSFPINRLELWAYLESERFLHPVMRQFYKERNVVIEERRMRTDSNPIGRLLEQFTQEAFAAHPYHRPTIGWISDLNSFSATDAQNFFDKYYVPSNMVVTVVGDVKVSQAMPIVEKYFSRIPTHPGPTRRRPPSHRRIPSGASYCTNRRSRSISKAIIVPITAARMTRSMTRSPT